ncbi:MAG TPA: hypothetical protein DCW74_19680 [Alteromonas australica]|jgi:hypothetical protein|uniref:Uncharacterized protein n=1 Tax=Alteromonas australica TaxID=589873 RepID=A0A075NWJ3_9ALTE|nr:hypothetical protein [Alteromonas australica]MAF70883.1 hypothetical protein [Alteromonas sp.]AIF97853.1 hypothetical protein EP13_03580 [Alteromonas australica]MBU34860.1 hypothetical protein [Alteromonas sp.]MBU35367.1 hypothetical protein [Alteromonas sp.]HAU26005.1 hypothetical protein [Alteromonas australica]|tara:strand:+ start:1516 stop:1980 length:465 start_codon:yes stop_codon:yes gene_type:complete
MKYLLVRFLCAWLTTYLFASLFHTSSVLYRLTQLDIRITPSIWLSTVVKDVLGLLPTYGAIIAIALLIGFVVTSPLAKKIALRSAYKQNERPILLLGLFALSGAAALATALIAMYPILNVTLIAGARGYTGFALQCLAGAMGGMAFALTHHSYK